MNRQVFEVIVEAEEFKIAPDLIVAALLQATKYIPHCIINIEVKEFEKPRKG